MRSKTKQKIIAEKKASKRKHKIKQNEITNARRCVTQRAGSPDEQFLMRLVLFLSINNQWYLSTSSSLEHCHPPPLEEQVTLFSQKDLLDKDEQLINILYDASVHPSKISKIMSAVKEDKKGTLLPKTIFNIKDKCWWLIDSANWILPACTDAEKTFKLLEL
jgi:hypothetical protein